jgi:SAM-dependent methyltransferase
MIQLAREYNRSPETCEYLVNDRPDLSLFPSGHFSFVYSALVLQHMPPRYALKYVREFLRALEPGGRLVFRIPLELLYIEEAPATSASTLAGLKERLRPRTRARHFVRRMQRRVAGSGEDEPYVMGMWSISESEIRRTVQSGKGKVVGVRRLDCPFDEVTPENRSAGTMRGYVDGEYSVVKLD